MQQVLGEVHPGGQYRDPR